MKNLAIYKSLQKAATTLGKRRATVEHEHVKPKVGKKEAAGAAATLGHISHSTHKKRKK